MPTKKIQETIQKTICMLALGLTMALPVSALADDAKVETPTAVKKAGRSVKDATCTMVKGKMECAGDKVKHKAENAGDDVKDKVNEEKGK